MKNSMRYSEKEKTEIFDKICNLIEGGMSLRKSLKKCNDFPKVTFLDWVKKDESKADQYARATYERTNLIFDDILEIADEAPERMETKTGSCIDTGHIQDKKLRIDARKWALSKMIPKKYGHNPEENTENKSIKIEVEYFEAEKPTKKQLKK